MEMTRIFFAKEKSEARIISLPAAQNIYMLYQKLAEDDFETDVVEILRDSVPAAKKILEGVDRQSIDEVYMFFDYDVHQNNTGHNLQTSVEVLNTMLSFFDNETEFGKLYISYPMVEALYDYRDGACESFSSCYVDVPNVNLYKRLSGEGNPNVGIHRTIIEWKMAINAFYLRLCCLYSVDAIDPEEYRNKISPLSIFNIEKDITIKYNKIFVLSGFPEFLLDYHKPNFWHSMIHQKRRVFDSCAKDSLVDYSTVIQ